jgi:hypothetical protein
MAQSKMVLLSSENRDVLLNECVLDAYVDWCSNGFKFMNMAGLFHQSYKELFVQLLVVGNQPELDREYIQTMMNHFCAVNWPGFAPLRDDMAEKKQRLTPSTFLKKYAKTMEVYSNSMLLWKDKRAQKNKNNLVGDPYKKVGSFEDILVRNKSCHNATTILLAGISYA